MINITFENVKFIKSFDNKVISFRTFDNKFYVITSKNCKIISLIDDVLILELESENIVIFED